MIVYIIKSNSISRSGTLCYWSSLTLVENLTAMFKISQHVLKAVWVSSSKVKPAASDMGSQVQICRDLLNLVSIAEYGYVKKSESYGFFIYIYKNDLINI